MCVHPSVCPSVRVQTETNQCPRVRNGVRLWNRFIRELYSSLCRSPERTRLTGGDSDFLLCVSCLTSVRCDLYLNMSEEATSILFLPRCANTLMRSYIANPEKGYGRLLCPLELTVNAICLCVRVCVCVWGGAIQCRPHCCSARTQEDTVWISM